MGAKGIEQLRQVKDFRVKDGRRHQLWLVLLFVIKSSEIATVQNLIAALDFDCVVFSLDALHCQKKLVKS